MEQIFWQRLKDNGQGLSKREKSLEKKENQGSYNNNKKRKKQENRIKRKVILKKKNRWKTKEKKGTNESN